MRLKTWFSLTLAAAAIVIGGVRADAADLLAYWNFNGFSITGPAAPGTGGAPTSIAANLGAGTLSFTGYGGTLDDVTGTLQNAPSGQTNEDAFSFVAGTGMAGNNTFIELSFDMTGRTNLGVSFSTQRTSTGYNSNQWSYSTDGISFTPFGSAITPTDVFSIQGPIVTNALDNAATAFLRYTFSGATSTSGNNRIDNLKLEYNAVPAPPLNGPTLPQPGDFVLGLSINNSTQSTEIVRGPVAPNGGVFYHDPWTTPFVQSMEFDNFDGQKHNVRGNLIAVDFGSAYVPATNTGGGLIYSLPTNGSTSGEGGTLIGNTRAAPDAIGHTGGVSGTRLAGVSVSPENDKIAVVGTDTATVIVYDYTPGDTTGDVPAPPLSGGRQTDTTAPVGNRFILNATQGTAWRDNNTIITFNAGTGDVYEVEANLDPDGPSATSLDTHYQSTVLDFPVVGGTRFSSVAYDPAISPYLYATVSGFAGTSQSYLFVMNPNAGYAQVGTVVDLSLSSQTAREIALDEAGNLFIGGFDSTISYIPASNFANDAAVAAIPDNSSIFWYVSPYASAAFTGMDIGFGEVSSLAGDHNKDGVVDQADFVAWAKDPTVFGGDPGGYNTWKQHFGEGSAGSGGGSGAVPEPSSLLVVVIGMAAMCFRRHAA